MIPRNDYKAYVKRLTLEEWQREWQLIPPTRNKLRNIKDTIAPYPIRNFSDRHWERTLCRLRIGHTALTHSFLMNRGEPPICEDCDVPLTVLHIFTECRTYANHRNSLNNIPFNTLMKKHTSKYDLVYNFLGNSGLMYEI